MKYKNQIDLRNDFQSADYSQKTDPHPAAYASDNIYDYINSIDWAKESNYHNSYHRLPKGRMIKMNNKKWHKLNK